MLRLSLITDYFFPRPSKDPSRKYSANNFFTAVLIPTYSPSKITYSLIESINKWNREVLVVVIDDCTPPTDKNHGIVKKIKKLSRRTSKVIYLRTEKNALKAGALNFGINYLLAQPSIPRIVFTMDDDVQIDQYTLKTLKDALYSHKNIGAVCSLVEVTNKNQNLLTRLQALEYHSFNISKIADNSWLSGPLVMQGMITGFRMSAMRQAKGFTTGHLIEDYDITARLKKLGWRVRIAPQAVASTTVPDCTDKLWRQRIRWTYGGLRVVTSYWRNLPLVFQDLIGHTIFLILLSLILLSLFLQGDGRLEYGYTLILAILAFANLFISMGYNILMLASYRKGDLQDWLIKLSIVPEFVYSNILSIVLLGSYLFFLYQAVVGNIAEKFKYLGLIYRAGLNMFQKVGYSSAWGTKEISKKGGINL